MEIRSLRELVEKLASELEAMKDTRRNGASVSYASAAGGGGGG